MSNLLITNLTKTYSKQNAIKQVVFADFNLEIKLGQIVALVGANGCGKTTLLNCLAGLIEFEKGSIKIDGGNSQQSDFGFVFQNYRETLLPWLKNIDNIACVLEQPGFSKLEKHNYIKHWANERDIVLPWDVYPYQCSGGQQQLLVLMREFINQPKLLLLDEPFGSLDYEKKLVWRQQLETLWQKQPTTVILVSHDIEEATYLADEVIVLGSSPTRICARQIINISHPRAPALLQSEIFFQYHRAILQAFLQTTSLV